MDKDHTRYYLRIAIGITIAILLMVGSSVAITEIDSCTTISEPGYYVLNKSIINSNAINCIYIKSSDVIFDGAGYTIDSSERVGNGININNYKNITLKNLILTDWEQGILYANIENGSITNNSVSNTYSGIYLGSSKNIILDNNNFSSNILGTGIYINYVSNITLSNNIVKDNREGIITENFRDSTLSHNIVLHNQIHGIQIRGNRGGSENNNISYNTVTENGYGIYLTSSENSTLDNNIASNNQFNGIDLGASSGSQLSNNTASNNYAGDGIYLNVCSGSNLSNNIVSNNFRRGIELSSSDNVKLNNNFVSDNGEFGIRLLSSNNNTLSDNNIRNNSYGIYFSNVMNNNIIYNNLFNNNNNYGFSGNNFNYWNTSKMLGINIIGGHYISGNFWSQLDGNGYSQKCIDSEPDGICDLPYQLNENNFDYLPLSIPDNEPPNSVTNLINITFAYTFINWTWTDPQDDDFSKVMIYLNGTFQTNVTNGTQYYNATGLTLDTIYEISIRTVDVAGNVNETWKNNTARTAPLLRVHNINKSTHYSTIQSAIDDADSGNEIHVDSGTYYGTMKVNKQITLSSTSGNPNDTILESPINSEDVINVSVDSVNISGFTLKNAFSMAGIYIGNGVDNSNISNNILMSNYFGIKLDYSSNNTLSGNKAFNNRLGIVLAHSNDNILKRNNASDNSYGINVAGLSSNNILVENIASSNNGYGLGRGDGIGINSWGNNNTLSGNTANLNNDSGIFLRSSTNILSENSVSKNDQGIYMESSDSNTVNSNNVANNNIGVYLWNSITNNINNNYFNNTNNYIQEGIIFGNTWNTTKTPGINIIGALSLGGNFWAYPNGTGFSQTCINTDGDGICDSPNILDANNIDYLPLTSINTILPAIRYINGTVKDHSTGYNLIGVKVSANSTLSTTTNENGFYSFAVTNGTYNLVSTIDDIRYYTNTTTVSTYGQAVVIRDIEMVRKPTGNITGSVTS